MLELKLIIYNSRDSTLRGSLWKLLRAKLYFGQIETIEFN